MPYANPKVRRLRACWYSMRNRCENPKDRQNYPHYGGRGIGVCERWTQFDNFAADMGERPPGTTLERIDNDGPYSPENCRWATRIEQARNTSLTIRVPHGDETLCLAEYCRRTGKNYKRILKRLAYGWSLERACATPKIPVNRQRRPRKTFTRQQIATICARRSAGEQELAIAKDYGVHVKTIQRFTRSAQIEARPVVCKLNSEDAA